MSKKRWMITRQSYYYTGEQVVEVSQYPDGAGPDMLVEMWPHLGEGKVYDCPTDIPHHAIAIRDAWIWHIFAHEGSLDIRQHPPYRVRFCNTGRYKIHRLWPLPEQILPVTIQVNSPGIHGMTGEPITMAQLKEWAQKAWDALPKCAGCGDPMDPDHWYYRPDDPTMGRDGEKYCSEHCATEAYRNSEAECERCGTVFIVKTGKWSDDGEHGFCSDPCLEAWENEEDEPEEEEDEDPAREAWIDYTIEEARELNRSHFDYGG